MMEAIKSKLPKCFPAPTTKTRLVQQHLDRIQGWYIWRVVKQEKLNEQRAKYKAKIGKVIRQRNFNNLYGDPKCAEIAIATAEVAGQSLSSGTQTYEPQKVDAAMQTEAAHLSPLENNQALIMLDMGDVQVMQTISEPFNPEQVHHVSAPQPQDHLATPAEVASTAGARDDLAALQAFQMHESDVEPLNELEAAADQNPPTEVATVLNQPEANPPGLKNPQHLYPVPSAPHPWMAALRAGSWVEPSLEWEALQGSVHPEALSLFRSALEPTHYPAIIQGVRKKLTSEEYAHYYPGSRLPYTDEARACKALKNRIKRRISPRFRQLEDVKKSRALIKSKNLPAELMPQLPDGHMTETQDLLIDFFFKQFVYYGSMALPVHFEGDDPTINSDTYGEAVLAQFAAKPDDYELFLSKQLAGQKNCMGFKEANPPTQYARTRCVLRVSSGPVPVEPQDEAVAEDESQKEPHSPTKKPRNTLGKVIDKENVRRSSRAKAKVSYLKTTGGDSESPDEASPHKKNRRQADQVEIGAKHTPKKKQNWRRLRHYELTVTFWCPKAKRLTCYPISVISF